MPTLFSARTFLVLSIALVFFGWVILGVDSIWGSDYYSLSEQTTTTIMLLPLLIIGTSAWMTLQGKHQLPKSGVHGVLLGALALGVWGANASDVLSGIGIAFMGLSIFGFVPYFVITISVVIGVLLGKALRWFVLPRT